jgi:hypothetical protein
VSGSSDHLIIRYWYDDAGRRKSATRGAGVIGTSTSYYYDAVSRMTGLNHTPPASADHFLHSFAYNPASQITSNVRTNDAYAWTGHGNGTTSSTANGRNQITVVGGTSTTHDARGNMTADGLGKTYGYRIENLFTSAPSAAPS